MLTENQKKDMNEHGYYIDTCPYCHGDVKVRATKNQMREYVLFEIFSGEFNCCLESSEKIREAVNVIKTWIDTGNIPCDCENGKIRRRW